MSIVGDPALSVTLEGEKGTKVEVPADSAELQRVYVSAPRDSAPAEAENTGLRLWVEDLTSGERAYRDTTFNGRGN
jgi:hypothetical protein